MLHVNHRFWRPAELVGEGVNGFLIELRDVDELAKHLGNSSPIRCYALTWAKRAAPAWGADVTARAVREFEMLLLICPPMIGCHLYSGGQKRQ
jgi:hypothetical protein